MRRFAARFSVEEGSAAAGRQLRDILLPADIRVTRVERGEERFIPDGNTVICAGDVLTAEGEADAREAKSELSALFGEELPE